MSDALEADLVATGRFARVESVGRSTGQGRVATVGFAPEPDGSILIAAGLTAAWARNLLADPACRVTVGDRTFDAVAEPLEGPDFGRAIRELILRYGTPAESLGSGPAFRLRPTGS
ncbi:MAG: nitroreductase family deazaflavin-dependent oxidoreductase [Chloroflexota bacterium]